MFCIYLEASSLDVDFSLVFHYYSTSKLKASSVSSSLVFDYHTLRHATQTSVVGVRNVPDLRMFIEILVELVVGSDLESHT